MRKNQISIKVERFGDQSENIPSTHIIFATRSDIADKRKDIEELQERFDILSAQSNAFDEI